MATRKKKKATKVHQNEAEILTIHVPEVAAMGTKRVKVTQLAAAAVAETAKTCALTYEEEQRLKTRLQYRLYQRNHRAKRLQQQQALENDVHTLHASVASLVDTLRTTWLEMATSVLDGYFRAFASSNGDEELLSAQVGAELAEEVVDQWRRFGAAFTDWRLEWQRESVRTIQQYDETVVVAVDVALHLNGSRDQFKAAFPGLLADEDGDGEHDNAWLIVKRDGLVVTGRGVYTITRSRVVEWYTLDLDGVEALGRVGVTQLDRIAHILSESLVSLSVGAIVSRPRRPSCETSSVYAPASSHEGTTMEPSNRRLSLTYLLS